MKKLLIALFLIFPTIAFAQSQRNPCYNTNLASGEQNCVPVGTSTPLPVTGSVTSSGPTPAGTNIIGQVGIDQTTPGTTNLVSTSPYPGAAVPITGNASGTTGAVVGTLANISGKTTYICGFDVSAIGGTASVGPITVAGLKGSSMVYQLASSATGVTLNKTYTPCIPANAANTAITITTTPASGATAVNVNSWGYQY